jgi:hypothetical protein
MLKMFWTVANLSGRYDLKACFEDRLGKDFMERIRKEMFIELKTESRNRPSNQQMCSNIGVEKCLWEVFHEIQGPYT